MRARRRVCALRTRPPSKRGATMHGLRLIMASFCAWASLVPLGHVEAQTNAAEFDPAVVEAVARDLGLSVQQARDRMRSERDNANKDLTLQQSLGTAYGGAWFDPTARGLVVATTDPRKVDEIVRNGARAVLVKRSIEQLNGIQRQLDQGALQLSQERLRSIWKWGVDVETNVVTITVPAGDPAALLTAQDFVTLSGVDADAVRIEQSTQGAPSLFQGYVARGGDRYNNTTDGVYCSIGFSVAGGGYVTAGHCSAGTTGDNVTGYNGVQQGTFIGSVFPGEDRAWVSVNGSWGPVPCVGTGGDTNCADAPNIQIAGSTEGAIGATVCRYGATTGGPRCGTIQNKNLTVVFDGVSTVNHMTQTNACSEPGDSGGPFVWNNQGQGTLTGGNGNCSSGGTSYFYPLNLTLANFGLTLLTATGVYADTATMTTGYCSAYGGYVAYIGYAEATPPCPAIGSLTPAILSTGQRVTTIEDVETWNASGNTVVISGFSSDPGSSWLVSVTVSGTTLASSNASFSYSASTGAATWGWSPAHAVQGGQVVVRHH